MTTLSDRTPPAPRMHPFAVLLVALITMATLWVVSGDSAGPVSAKEDRGAPLEPPVALYGAGEGYVGDQTCARCHIAEHKAWRSSSHAQTFEPVGPDNLPTEVLDSETAHHPPGKSRFQKRGSHYDVYTTGPSGKEERFDLTHVVGRMRVRMYIATLEDGRRQVLPGMLEEPTREWFDYTKLLFGGESYDKPPVVSHTDGSFWTGPVRAWDTKCARCHTSGLRFLEPQPGELGRRTTERRLGVDCEMCHGPGQDHVEHHEAKAEGQDPILQYAKLARERQVSVCLRCHMESEVDDPHFVVGDDIFEHVTPTLILEPNRIDAYGRVIELIYDGVPFSASRCATEGQLTCTTCHDPHGSSQASQLRTNPADNASCTQCHDSLGANVVEHAHHSDGGSGGQCISCHMPFLSIERGHGVVADHSISVPRLGMPGDRVAQDACTWCHQGGLAAPGDAPKLDDAALRKAYEEWWPGGGVPHAWMEALADARMDKPAALGPLLATARDTTAPRVVRASATRLLERRADEVPVGLLVLARDADSLVRRSAYTAMQGLEGKAIDAALLRGLADESAAVRAAAARAALSGWQRVQENTELLQKVLPVLEEATVADPGDEDRWFRLGAARQLAGDLRGALEAYRRQAALDVFASNIRTQIERIEQRLQKADGDK